MSYAIGIDLGTTYSCVGVFRNQRVEIIPNELGKRTTPSCVAFNSFHTHIGEAAVNERAENPTNTIFGIKRIIGKDSYDDVGKFPFEITKLKSGLVIKVSFNGKKRKLKPELISAMILRKLKTDAEIYLGADVKNAVITVPATFNDKQRQATKDAALIAGLNVKRIINEPTAAALSYGIDKKQETLNVLVYDLGGGTLDVSLLEVTEGKFTVKATAGISHLGGEDFDDQLVNYLVSDINKQFKEDILRNPRVLMRLKLACERAKIMLSAYSQTTIELDSLVGGHDYSVIVTRAKFENLCLGLFKRTLDPIKQVLRENNECHVDEIVMVGGSSKIPKIQEIVSLYFGNKVLNTSMNPDEAIAAGAAIQAAMLSKNCPMDLEKITLVDITPLSLGIEITGKVFDIVVPKNSILPVKVTKGYTTAFSNQTLIKILVLEGERPLSTDNRALGEFVLKVPKAPIGTVKIDVSFTIDENGILTVSAVDKMSYSHKEIIIEGQNRRLTNEEIKAMVKEAEEFRAVDEKKLRAVRAVKAEKELRLFLSSINFSEDGELGSVTLLLLRKEIELLLTWLEKNKNSNLGEEFYLNKKQEIMKRLNLSYDGTNSENYEFEELLEEDLPLYTQSNEKVS